MRVLLVTHEASRSGAPRVALLVVKVLVERGHSVTVVSRRHGPLVTEFQELAPTRVEPLHRLRRNLWAVPAGRWLGRLMDMVVVAWVVAWSRPDVVYLNSTACSSYIRPSLWLGRRVVVHAHESGAVARRFLRSARATRAMSATTLVACSPSVRSDLAELVGVPLPLVFLLPSVPDSREVLRLAQAEPDRTYGRDELVIGCCGRVEPRKGPDLWLEAARRVEAALPHHQLRFVWLGEVVNAQQSHLASQDPFVGPTSNPYAHMKRFDISTLPSRDDPFPLVVLEAMIVGTPVVAFDTGSVSEQIGPAGIVVAAGDVDAFARAVTTLVLDNDRRARLGRLAQIRAGAKFSTEVFAERLAAVMASVVQSERS